MNKKQLITVVVMALLLCFVILFAPKIYLTPYDGGYLARTKPIGHSIAPHLNWDFVLQRSAVILIIGGLLILILQNPLNMKLKFSKLGLRAKIILYATFLCALILAGILIIQNSMLTTQRINKESATEKSITHQNALRLEAEKRELETKWAQLKIGMTQSEVLSILGEPTYVNNSGYLPKWQYDNGGVVTFSPSLDKNPSLMTWREPYSKGNFKEEQRSQEWFKMRESSENK